jgi:aldehyde dehydrogenase (NAD+)
MPAAALVEADRGAAAASASARANSALEPAAPLQTSVPQASAQESQLLESLSQESSAQESSARECWARTSLSPRLALLRRARHLLAARADSLAAALSPGLARNRADTLVAEVLPLLAACRFLEQASPAILRTRHLGRKGLPFWLAGLETSVERVPLGVILIIAPANYPLLLAGVQTLQALAAGNAVVWKPGSGGRAVAEIVRTTLEEAGLAPGLLRVTGESIEAANHEIDQRPAKIVFTGSAHAGQAVQALAARHSIPVIAELSGCDAVFVLPGANPDLVVDALAFGMRLNGSATCMAPRRLFLLCDPLPIVSALHLRFASMEPVALPAGTRNLLAELLADACAHGARILGEADAEAIRPLLVGLGSPALRLAQTDLFAPVLSVFEARSEDQALKMNALCPYALTAAVFGPEPAARAFAARLDVGTVTINDLIVPTADPRISFGGRRASGFGVTRGAEGLLEMTAVKTTAVRHGKSRRHLQPTTAAHENFFRAIIEMSHAASWRARIRAARALVASAKNLK